MKDIRLWFKKCDEAVYISHLDLNRTITHAINASQLDIWYTQGFNPHPFVTFALPLPLGIAGLNESMDIRLTSSNINNQIIKEKLNRYLPNSIRVLKISDPLMKPNQIHIASFKIILNKNIKDKIEEFFNINNIPVIKKSKSGEKQINLKDHILYHHVELSHMKTIVSIKLPAGNQFNISPILITKKFFETFPSTTVPEIEIIRLKLLNEAGQTWM